MAMRRNTRTTQQTKRKRARRQQDVGRVKTSRVKIEEIDWKDVAFLQRLVSAQGKLFSRKRTGLDSQCQSRATHALKVARYMALMPYVT